MIEKYQRHYNVLSEVLVEENNKLDNMVKNKNYTIKDLQKQNDVILKLLEKIKVIKMILEDLESGEHTTNAR